MEKPKKKLRWVVFKQKVKQQLTLFKLKFGSVDKELKIIFIFSIAIVFLLEFVNLSELKSLAHLSNFLQKLSYAFISGFIFFLLSNHLPKQRRKMKANHYISAKMNHYTLSIRSMFDVLWLLTYGSLNSQVYVESDKLSNEEINKLCSKIQARKPFTVSHYDLHCYGKTFPDAESYISFKIKEFRSMTQEIMVFYDLLDKELLLILGDLESQFMLMDKLIAPNRMHPNLYLLSSELQTIYTLRPELSNEYSKLISKYYYINHKDRMKRKRPPLVDANKKY